MAQFVLSIFLPIFFGTRTCINIRGYQHRSIRCRIFKLHVSLYSKLLIKPAIPFCYIFLFAFLDLMVQTFNNNIPIILMLQTNRNITATFPVKIIL